MCAQIAGLQDFRGEGPPGDIGVFQAAASIIIHQFTFSGVAYYVAQKMGERGWVLVSQGADAGPVINNALAAAAALGAYAGRRASVVIVGNGSSFVSTVAITAQSYVDVYCVGAEIVVDTSATVNGVNFASVTNSVWRDVVVRRKDTTPIVAVVHAAYFSGTCDKTLRLEGCRFLNEVTAAVNDCYGIYMAGSSSPTMTGCTGTGGAGGAYCHGIYMAGSSSPTMTGCTGTGGAGGAYCHGIYMAGSSSPTMTGCTGTGGAGGAYCYGIVMVDSSSPTMTGCTGTGGAGGAYCHGIYMAGSSSPTMTGCTGTGGAGGTYCYGIRVDGSSSPTMTGCTGTGGAGGAYCYGIVMADSSSPTMTGCTGTGGAGGANCHGIYMAGSSSPTMTGCTGIGGKRTNYWWTYASANNGRFQPYATAPYILVGVYVSVSAAAAPGTTLSLGTSIGGFEIAAGIPIDSTGVKYFNIANVEVAAAGYMYATPSAGIAEGSLSVRYVVMTNYATCYALYIDTRGAARFADGTLLANGASDAFYVTDVAEAANAWRLTNSHVETLDPTNQRSIISQSAYDPAPVYNCFLRGLVVNIVPAAGTAVGSNIQE